MNTNNTSEVEVANSPSDLRHYSVDERRWHGARRTGISKASKTMMMHIKWVDICGGTNKGRSGLCLSGHGDDDIDSKSDMFLSGGSCCHFLIVLKIIIEIIILIFKISGESGFGVIGWILGVIIALVLADDFLGVSGVSLLLHFQGFDDESVVFSLPSCGIYWHVLSRWNNNWVDRNRYLVGSGGWFLSFKDIFVAMKMKKMITIRFLMTAWSTTTRLGCRAWCVVMLLRGSHSTSRLDWAWSLKDGVTSGHWKLIQVLLS